MEIGGNSSRKHGDTNWYISSSSSGGSHALIFPPALVYQSSCVHGASGSHPPDPHRTWLKLGKRQYYYKETRRSYLAVGKRGESREVRCQVEGCKAELGEAKHYHRRHKVCEMHSKAPFVTLLGLQQRFCQQCSRFHLVSEFDDAKRSCRRRLAGHNERRRKSSNQYVTRNYSQGCAYSLLSSKSDKWDSSSDLSSRSRAALCELIAEHRAAILARRAFEQNLHNNHIFQELVDQYRPAVGGFSSFPFPPASNS